MISRFKKFMKNLAKARAIDKVHYKFRCFFQLHPFSLKWGNWHKTQQSQQRKLTHSKPSFSLIPDIHVTATRTRINPPHNRWDERYQALNAGLGPGTTKQTKPQIHCNN